MSTHVLIVPYDGWAQITITPVDPVRTCLLLLPGSAPGVSLTLLDSQTVQAVAGPDYNGMPVRFTVIEERPDSTLVQRVTARIPIADLGLVEAPRPAAPAVRRGINLKGVPE